jgi:hypothetical protein
MTADGLTRERHRALAAFFSAHQRQLERAVFGQARNLDPGVIHDACAIAWLALVRRPDVTLDQRLRVAGDGRHPRNLARQTRTLGDPLRDIPGHPRRRTRAQRPARPG